MPHLGLNAWLYHGIESTSCQAERFSPHSRWSLCFHEAQCSLPRPRSLCSFGSTSNSSPMKTTWQCITGGHRRGGGNSSLELPGYNIHLTASGKGLGSFLPGDRKVFPQGVMMLESYCGFRKSDMSASSLICRRFRKISVFDVLQTVLASCCFRIWVCGVCPFCQFVYYHISKISVTHLDCSSSHFGCIAPPHVS